jgi:acetyl/propionyl-CoA carboxylase alpha subunit
MRCRYQVAGKIHDIRLDREGSLYHAVIDGEPVDFEVLERQPGQITLRFQGRPVTLYIAEDDGTRWVSYLGCTFKLEKPDRPSFQREAEGSQSNLLRSPMPSLVREIQVNPGDVVSQGQTLMILEAMKMEIRIQAPKPARVAQLAVQTGDQVDRDQVLVELADQEEE